MEVEVVQVDAFAAEPFRGNPAAVCFLPASSGEHHRGWPTDQWLQHLAAEMNLSETAFLLPSGSTPSFVIVILIYFDYLIFNFNVLFYFMYLFLLFFGFAGQARGRRTTSCAG